MSDNKPYNAEGREESQPVDSDTLYNIETEETDNLYSLPEDSGESESEDGFDPDDKGAFENEGSLESDEEDAEDEADEEENEEGAEIKSGKFSLLFKIMSTPVEGWKELKRRRYPAEEVASGLFYPTVAMASLSEFAGMIYTTIGVGECLMNALVAFISFFFGYFTVLLLCGGILPKASKGIMKTSIGKEFIMVNMSTLALFFTAINLFPMIDAVLVFLPIWTIYLIYKGVRILRIPESVETRTKILLTFLIVGAPVLWSWLMELFFEITQ
ncbi:MAG: YIP1 family protein [Muribaculaceae bacterium]|nr:YIP1 family protein [Muribaculaceae bacterium]